MRRPKLDAHCLAGVLRAEALVLLIEEALRRGLGGVAIAPAVLAAVLARVVLRRPVIVATAGGRTRARLGLAALGRPARP